MSNNDVNLLMGKDKPEEIKEQDRINVSNIPPNGIGERELDSTFISTLVTETSTNTLTNKTLTSPTITNPTTTGTDSGAETLTNKTIVATSNTISAIDNTMMTNRTRSVWLAPGTFILSEGTPVLVTGAIDTPPSWLLDDTTVESVISNIIIPKDYATGNITVKTYFKMASSNSGNVVIHIRALSIADGADATGGGTSQEDTVAVPGTTGNIKIYTQSVTFATSGADDMFRVCCRRIGTSGSDTATGDMAFLGIKLEYTADM